MLPHLQLACLQSLTSESLALHLYSHPLAALPLATLADQAWYHFDHHQIEAAIVLFTLIQARAHVSADAYFQEVAHNSLQFLATELAQRPAAASAVSQPSPEAALLRLEAEVHLKEGQLCYEQGWWADALHHLESALQIFTALQVAVGVGRSLALMGEIHRTQGHGNRAQAYSQAAATVLENTPAQRDRAQALTCLGLAHWAEQDCAQARQALEAALHLYQSLKAPFEEGRVLTWLGQVYAGQREFMFALACYEATLDLYLLLPSTREVEWQTAQVLTRLGYLCEQTGRPELAIAPYQDALERYQRLEDGVGGRHLARCLGRLHEDQGRFTLALDYYQQALADMPSATLTQLSLRCDDFPA
jgi:tetratricopeptide (TPR) repeat protein